MDIPHVKADRDQNVIHTRLRRHIVSWYKQITIRVYADYDQNFNLNVNTSNSADSDSVSCTLCSSILEILTICICIMQTMFMLYTDVNTCKTEQIRMKL